MAIPRARGFSSAKLAALVVVAGVLFPAASRASITVGSDLALPATPFVNNCGFTAPPCTVLTRGVHAGNAFPASSPAGGLVTSFAIKSGSADTVKFRLIKYVDTSGHTVPPATASFATGAGTGPTVHLPGPGTYVFPASIPVHAGDFVGFDTSSTRANQAEPCAVGQLGFLNAKAVLSDGGPPQPLDGTSNCELLVNAVIQPSNAFTFGKTKLSAKRGTATVKVNVPGPGELSLRGKNVIKASAGIRRAVVSKRVGAAGAVKLPVRPVGKTKQRLRESGKAKVKLKITFSPTGGVPSTQSRKLKLVQR